MYVLIMKYRLCNLKQCGTYLNKMVNLEKKVALYGFLTNFVCFLWTSFHNDSRILSCSPLSHLDIHYHVLSIMIVCLDPWGFMHYYIQHWDILLWYSSAYIFSQLFWLSYHAFHHVTLTSIMIVYVHWWWLVHYHVCHHHYHVHSGGSFRLDLCRDITFVLYCVFDHLGLYTA